MVDAAILGSRQGHRKTLGKVGPDVVFLGYDQDSDHKTIKKLYPKDIPFKIVRSDKPLKGYSTSRISRGLQ